MGRPAAYVLLILLSIPHSSYCQTNESQNDQKMERLLAIAHDLEDNNRNLHSIANEFQTAVAKGSCSCNDREMLGSIIATIRDIQVTFHYEIKLVQMSAMIKEEFLSKYCKERSEALKSAIVHSARSIDLMRIEYGYLEDRSSINFLNTAVSNMGKSVDMFGEILKIFNRVVGVPKNNI